MANRFAFKLPMYAQPVDAPFAPVIELAQLGERLGFSTVYVIDHLVLPGERFVGKSNADPTRPYFLDAWCTLAAVAATTSTIKLGPQVTPIGLRHPVFVAKWGATIDRISEGRFVLGVGLGHQEIEYVSHGFPYPGFKERYARMIEGIEIIKALWTTDGPVTYDGEHYQIKDVNFWPKPIQDPPEIWFGGTSPSIRRGVARLGDGWFPAAPQLGGIAADFFRDSLTEINTARAEHGRTGELGVGSVFLTTISEDEADIERAADLLRKRPEYADLSVEEINDKGVIIMGTPDQVAERLEPFFAAGVEEITLSFHPLDDMDGIRRGLQLYADKVFPRFC